MTMRRSSGLPPWPWLVFLLLTSLLFSWNSDIVVMKPCHSFLILPKKLGIVISPRNELYGISSITHATLTMIIGHRHENAMECVRGKVSPLFNDKSSNNNNFGTHEEFSNDDDVTDIQQRLVQKGLSWKQSSLEELPNMTRVPGCVATVHVLATVGSVVDGDDDHTARVRLFGNADAVFSRGLLCVLSELLETQSLNQVLQLDPQKIADTLGMRPALSKGRNDGLANMLTIIQNQLHQSNDNNKATTSNDDEKNCPKQTITTQNATDSKNAEQLNVPSTGGERPKVALLLSGGVDSSVALRLLLQQEYDVVSFYLKIWLEDELAHLGQCPWEDDVQTCRQVCEQAGVNLEIVSLQDEYHRRVMQHTLNEASLGRTPNPDILCNSRVKFGCFLEYLESLPQKFDFVASGHYARVERMDAAKADQNGNGQDGTAVVKLYRAPDPVKDQSYFLCALNQSQLRCLLFPIGHLEKTEVRQLAEDFNLPNRHRPDSQGLCFLGKVKFRDFMQIHLGESSGDIVDAFSGDVIGQHHGVWYHTVGQRKGIGPYLIPQATAVGPWYVVAKDPSKNVVYASNQYDEDIFAQARSEFHVENLHWIAGDRPEHLLGDDGRYRLTMKIRHGPKLANGTLTILDDDDGDGDSGGIVELHEKDGGLAPGQYVVFYTDEAECLGGGIISERHWTKFLVDAMSRANKPTHKKNSSDTISHSFK